MLRKIIFFATVLLFTAVPLLFADAEIPTVLSPPEELGVSIREVQVAQGRKLVALTFDLCEAPRETAGFDRELVSFLADNRVKATFFAGGKWMRSHPEETMELMLQPLFEIGNHSWGHANFRNINMEEARNQVLLTQQQYRSIRDTLASRLGSEGPSGAIAAVPEYPRLFRFPYGACTSESLSLLASLNMPAIQWSVVSGDPAPDRTSRMIVQIVMAQVKPGAIMIFHANGKGHGTLGAMREIIPKLRSQGYEFTTVSELLATGTPVSAPQCYEIRPGDTLKYDRPIHAKKSSKPAREDRK